MATVNIALPDDLDLFIRKKVESGAYDNATDVVTDALRRLELESELSDQDRLEVLRHALQPGLDDIAARRLSDRTATDFMREAKAPRR